MKSFWLFRSNIRALEYYHEFKDLETFETKCHDYYMLFPIWLLRNNYFDEVVIWRLGDYVRDDIIFNVNGKKFIQRWVRNFTQTLKYPPPEMSLWRGGFREYDDITKFHPEHFGMKLYLGTGQRTYPRYGGEYDVILQEDEQDFRPGHNCIPFYKTASPHIFKRNVFSIRWDICWPCNFTQIRYKGQNEFIDAVASSPSLQKLSIVHCGNKPEAGKAMCLRSKVKNIKFLGWKSREELCNILNQSKFGLCMSNRNDGCPRVATEILMTKTPMIISEKTRLLPSYKKNGVVEVNDRNIEEKILWAMENHFILKSQTKHAVKHEISFDKICKKNIMRWKKL
jgi:Glycosyl transferases group 1